MSQKKDLALMGLAEAAQAVARGRVSAQALTEACLAQIEEWQPRVNAFLKLEAAAALKAAKAVDRARKRGAKLGRLAGVPLAHKDMYYRAGKETSCGSAIRRHWKATETSTALERLDAEGALDLGRLNMAEFAFGPTGHNYHYGHARNPWNTDRITGGSSSGSAAAVAARMAFGALGSDTGGSIRLPAHYCGLVGMKPTWGRVSRAACMPLSYSLDTVGPLTRRVEDNALLLEILAGADPRDPTASSRPVDRYLAAARSGAVRGMKLAVPRAYFWDKLNKASAESLEATLKTFAKLGVKIIEITPPDMEMITSAAMVMMSAEAAALHAPWLRTRPHLYSDQVRARLENGLALSALDYIDAQRWRGEAVAAFVKAMNGADAIFAPVADKPAPTIAETDVAGKPEAGKVIATLTRLTRPINYLGLPGLTVPAGFVRGGMPVGFQLIGRPFDEALLYRLGGAYEAKTRHYERVPV
ncbi:amidase [uncultured Ferrovibrio sp.]|jgi:aspartyl-tRNA(Asn)/glutamyl-tRNA(Gln) amidotransferase subunit A|uniref:amidase n=1 Tax=uncultured Ferrovibrio sp. TaxID=1576913 RepID=UPI0026185A04|nr:amidase [uncultured Ferrovibrio sp.]